MGKRGRAKDNFKPNTTNSSDWEHINTSRNKHGKYFIEQQIERHDRSELKRQQSVYNPGEPVILNKIFARKNNAWVHIGYRCTSCDRTMKDEKVIAKHNDTCERINTYNTEEDFMPIQRIMQNGEVYYRWGDHGKLYKNRSDAEKQAQAAYASGYKSKDMTPKEKK